MGTEYNQPYECNWAEGSNSKHELCTKDMYITFQQIYLQYYLYQQFISIRLILPE